MFARVDGGAWVWDVMGVLLSRASFTQMLFCVSGLPRVSRLDYCVMVMWVLLVC
jgi:hypothetical protein